MPGYHQITTFLNYALPQLRATRRTNLALLTAAILDRRTLAISVLVRAWFIRLALFPPSAQEVRLWRIPVPVQRPL